MQQNGRRPKGMMPKMEDYQNGRRPEWETTKIIISPAIIIRNTDKYQKSILNKKRLLRIIKGTAKMNISAAENN